MSQIINLISDTVTQPTPAMLQFMMKAKVGDDVFGEDPSVNQLQEKIAHMFGKEAALFCPSGTMTNQIAIKVHTQPLDELICDESSHVYQYETGGYAFHSGVAVNLLKGDNGKITSSQIEKAIKPTKDWLPHSKLVVLENTCNKGGGSYYTLEEIMPISQLCKDRGLKLHLDGARLFNALVETSETPYDWGQQFDSLSICFSKGLGAPVGSILISDEQTIHQARRFRKVMGGGMRQAGILAAACEYALNNHVEKLKIDNDRAKVVGHLLQTFSKVDYIKPVFTNILIFKLKDNYTDVEILEDLKKQGILAAPFGENTLRFVFHSDISESMFTHLLKVLPEALK